MQDNEFKQLILANLAKIESKTDTLTSTVYDIKTDLAIQGKDIGLIMKDIPEIKEDLRQHKEGNIQNRTRIEHIERLNLDQDDLINKTLLTYQKEVAPVIAHVVWIQAIPKKIIKGAITAAKFLAALGAIAGPLAGIVAYFTGFFKH